MEGIDRFKDSILQRVNKHDEDIEALKEQQVELSSASRDHGVILEEQSQRVAQLEDFRESALKEFKDVDQDLDVIEDIALDVREENERLKATQQLQTRIVHHLSAEMSFMKLQRQIDEYKKSRAVFGLKLSDDSHAWAGEVCSQLNKILGEDICKVHMITVRRIRAKDQGTQEAHQQRSTPVWGDPTIVHPRGLEGDNLLAKIDSLLHRFVAHGTMEGTDRLKVTWKHNLPGWLIQKARACARVEGSVRELDVDSLLQMTNPTGDAGQRLQQVQHVAEDWHRARDDASQYFQKGGKGGKPWSGHHRHNAKGAKGHGKGKGKHSQQNKGKGKGSKAGAWEAWGPYKNQTLRPSVMPGAEPLTPGRKGPQKNYQTSANSVQSRKRDVSTRSNDANTGHASSKKQKTADHMQRLHVVPSDSPDISSKKLGQGKKVVLGKPVRELVQTASQSKWVPTLDPPKSSRKI